MGSSAKQIFCSNLKNKDMNQKAKLEFQIQALQAKLMDGHLGNFYALKNKIKKLKEKLQNIERQQKKLDYLGM